MGQVSLTFFSDSFLPMMGGEPTMCVASPLSVSLLSFLCLLLTLSSSPHLSHLILCLTMSIWKLPVFSLISMPALIYISSHFWERGGEGRKLGERGSGREALGGTAERKKLGQRAWFEAGGDSEAGLGRFGLGEGGHETCLQYDCTTLCFLSSAQ